MATKVVQNVNRIQPSVGVASTSNPIPLKSGYLQISIASTGVGCFVETGENPVATFNSFHIPTYGNEVIKERIARQQISGITTGATTVVTFPQNAGNPFLLTDYVTIQNASPAGINTSHVPIVSMTESSITIASNTSSITGTIGVSTATICRSVKVSAITNDVGTVHVTEVVLLVSE